MKLIRVVEALKVSLLATWLLISLGLGWWGIRMRVPVEQTLESINRAAANTADASATAKEAAVEQKKYWAMTSLQTYKVITDLKGFIFRTDRSLNERLVPRLSAALDGTTDLTRAAADDLNRTSTELAPTLVNLARGSAAFADSMSSPHIESMLANVDETSRSVADTTRETAATMTKVHEGVVYEVDSLMKPVGKVKAAALIVIRFVGRFFGF